MHIYRLETILNWENDYPIEYIIVASSEEKARIRADVASYGGTSNTHPNYSWCNPNFATCVEVSQNEGEILSVTYE